MCADNEGLSEDSSDKNFANNGKNSIILLIPKSRRKFAHLLLIKSLKMRYLDLKKNLAKSKNMILSMML